MAEYIKSSTLPWKNLTLAYDDKDGNLNVGEIDFVITIFEPKDTKNNVKK